MVSEERRVFGGLAEDVFEVASDLTVQPLALLTQDARVGRLLREGMLEDVLPFRPKRPLADELASQQIRQRSIQLGRLTGDRGQRAVLEEAADDRGLLQDGLGGARQAVDASGQDAPKRRRNLPVLCVSAEAPSFTLAPEDALLNEGTDDFFQEERIPLCASSRSLV
jgi:hypothetical protein